MVTRDNVRLLMDTTPGEIPGIRGMLEVHLGHLIEVHLRQVQDDVSR
jgi:hypothetical protein